MTVLVDENAPGHLLVMGDSRSTRRLSEGLTAFGFTTTTTSSLDRACIAYGETNPDAILIVGRTDWKRDLEPLITLSALRPKKPILVLARSPEFRCPVELMRAGATDVLEMGSSPEGIVQAIERAQAIVDRERVETWSRGDFGLTGKSPVMRALFRELEVVAPSALPVLVRGEPGTGKTQVAYALHEAGLSSGGPFIVIRCSSMTALAWHQEVLGEFDDSASERIQPIAARARGGTLFIDEVESLNLKEQAQLVRILEPHISSTWDRPAFRVVCTTAEDLHASASEGRFRRDLLDLISAVELRVPPIREREGDIEVLTEYFLEAISRRDGVAIPAMSSAARDALSGWHWPGNLREFRNVIERALLLSPEEGVLLDHLPDRIRAGREEEQPTESTGNPDLSWVTEGAIMAAMAKYGGNVAAAGRALNMSRSTLYRRLKTMGMR